MFGIRWKSRGKKATDPVMAKQDNLNHIATGIAIKLIQGDCDAVYRQEMTQLFLEAPGFVDDVNPEYRQALKEFLKKEEGSSERSNSSCSS